jgi:hypothetical protein
LNKECWGGKYSQLERIVPKHLRGEGKGVIKELVKIGWLIPKKKAGTSLFRLNPEKKAEIEQYYSQNIFKSE